MGYGKLGCVPGVQVSVLEWFLGVLEWFLGVPKWFLCVPDLFLDGQE